MDQMQKYIDAFDDIQKAWWDEATARNDKDFQEMINCWTGCDGGVIDSTTQIRLCEKYRQEWSFYTPDPTPPISWELYWRPLLFKASPIYIIGCSIFSTCRCCLQCWETLMGKTVNSIAYSTGYNPEFEEWRQELTQKIRDLAARIQRQIELIKRKEAECITILQENTRGSRNTNPPTRGTQG